MSPILFEAPVVMIKHAAVTASTPNGQSRIPGRIFGDIWWDPPSLSSPRPRYSVHSFVFIQASDPNYELHVRYLPEIARDYSSFVSMPTVASPPKRLNGEQNTVAEFLGPNATVEERRNFKLIKDFGATALMTDLRKVLNVDTHDDDWFEKIAKIFHNDALVQIEGIDRVIPSGEYHGRQGIQELSQLFDSLHLKFDFKSLDEGDFKFSTDLARFDTDLTRSLPHLNTGLVALLSGSFVIVDLKSRTYKLSTLLISLQPLSRLQVSTLDDHFADFANDFHEYVDGEKVFNLREFVEVSDASSITATTPSDSGSTGMTTLGVRLSFFHKFIKKCGTRAAFSGLTTADVNAKIVQPATLYAKASLVDCLLAYGDTHNIGPADWFVSHAWMYPFLDVVDALDRYFDNANSTGQDENPDPFLWFDLYTNSQHDTATKPFEFWETTFILMLRLYPLGDPESTFEVTMTSYQSSLFSEMIGNSASICKILNMINTANSQASNPADRDMIFQSVTKGGLTLQQIDTMVRGVFREWMIRESQRRLDLSVIPNERAAYTAAIAALLEMRGSKMNVDVAEEHYLRKRQARPDRDENTPQYISIESDGRVHLPEEATEPAFSHYVRLYAFSEEMQYFYLRHGRFDRALPFAAAAAYTNLAQDGFSARALLQFCLFALVLERTGQAQAASYWFGLTAYIVQVLSTRTLDDVKRLGTSGANLTAYPEPGMELAAAAVTAAAASASGSESQVSSPAPLLLLPAEMLSRNPIAAQGTTARMQLALLCLEVTFLTPAGFPSRVSPQGTAVVRKETAKLLRSYAGATVPEALITPFEF
ncbi:hypothetical protein HK405_015596 [Cladochytrium tenue]|nr:hypothetical protein HK405_015596 [Cladochytrium tenue]